MTKDINVLIKKKIGLEEDVQDDACSTQSLLCSVYYVVKKMLEYFLYFV